MRLIRRKELEKKLGISRSTIYEALKNNPEFPRQVHIMGRVGWLEEEIDDYIRMLIKRRDDNNE